VYELVNKITGKLFKYLETVPFVIGVFDWRRGEMDPEYEDDQELEALKLSFV
jgi:hypothetical protein